MKIGIIECGKNREEWAEHGEFGTWFPPLLKMAGVDFTYEIFNAMDMVLPDPKGDCDAYLLTGSPASAYENSPWQDALTAFLLKVVEVKPIIGICYGHQHLHQILGGKVVQGDTWGLGVASYALEKTPDWLPKDIAKDSENGFDLVALHKDQVVELAPNSVVYAGNAHCSFGVTTIGQQVLTFQNHPEMDPNFAQKVYEFERHRIGDTETEAGLACLHRPADNALAARWIMAFLNHHLAQKESVA